MSSTGRWRPCCFSSSSRFWRRICAPRWPTAPKPGRRANAERSDRGASGATDTATGACCRRSGCTGHGRNARGIFPAGRISTDHHRRCERGRCRRRGGRCARGLRGWPPGRPAAGCAQEGADPAWRADRGARAGAGRAGCTRQRHRDFHGPARRAGLGGQQLPLANATEYGLAGAVWTADLSHAHRMVRAIRAGVVHVNTYGGADITVPPGGMKQSGNGVDKSLHAFDKFTDLKTAWIAL
ncbi:MAG: aldehyde dehydrogenase family protein [Alphaproteobacteria bacterium]|nr:MAG: aldehyde dehydrogenase family protein [Alphaproteobacteria bacterium]